MEKSWKEELSSLYKPWLNQDLHLQYGKFVSPFGAYNQRHDTAADPFIRPPLMYDYRTMVSFEFLPRSNDGFIGWKYAPNIWRPRGAPAIGGNPHQLGAMVFGGFRQMDFRFAVMNSAPSSEPNMWNHQIGHMTHPSYVAHIGYRILPEFYLGMAYNAGPYLGERAKVLIDDADFNLEARAEHTTNHTQGPHDPRDDLFSVQCRIEF